jgi:hypothetical protein
VTDVLGLYAAAEDDVKAITAPLVDFGKQWVRKSGSFYPFGAVLDASGSVHLHAAAPGSETPDVAAVLDLLREGLREARQPDSRAVATCEWVKVTPQGSATTDAIKVHVEHANGLSVALYQPLHKKGILGWQSGKAFIAEAAPEIGK